MCYQVKIVYIKEKVIIKSKIHCLDLKMAKKIINNNNLSNKWQVLNKKLILNNNNNNHNKI